jgi:hypothetical protein
MSSECEKPGFFDLVCFYLGLWLSRVFGHVLKMGNFILPTIRFVIATTIEVIVIIVF